MERLHVKDRWGITLLLFFILSGLFSFLLYRNSNPIKYKEYYISELHEIEGLTEKKDILYNYHSYNEKKVRIIQSGQDKKTEEKSVEKKTFIYHKVARGETLWKIADKYSVSISSLIQNNNIENPDLIYSGEVLKVQSVM
jgi:murein DD-endopeptidase MepM/ murein hydrolase activator NlpD